MPGYDGYNPYTSTGTYTGTTGTTKPGTSGGYQHPGTGTGTSGTKTTSGLTGRDAALQSAADESANKYLTGIAEMATDEYGRLRNIYDLETNKPLLTFEDGKLVRTVDRGGRGFDEYGRERNTWVGDKGQLLSDLERMQLAALKMGHKTSLGVPVHGGSQFGSGLGALIALDSGGKPMYTSEGNLIYTGLGGVVSDNLNKILGQYDDPSGYGQGDMLKDIIDKYYAGFDQRWSGRDDFDHDFYGPTEVSEKFAGGDWRAKGLGEILAEGPKGFDEMEGIYDPEFKDREASWLYLTGIPQFSDQTIYDYV